MIRRNFIALALLSSLTPLTALAAPLSVTVNGIEARGGKLYIGVQTEAQFLQQGGVAGKVIDAPAAGSLTASFDVPEGAYSVSVWHDINENGIFDKDDKGWPLDGWSMINADKLTGKPSFNEVRIDVPAEGAHATETVRYPE